ncbi:hypothetical protein [Bosea sp. (in: a-proteobacteria)]
MDDNFERWAAGERQRKYQFRLMIVIALLSGVVAGLLIKRWLGI